MISAAMSNSVTAQLPEDVQLHVQTPLIFSAPLSKVADRPVFLKLENTQPSGSFKLRGKAILSIFLYLTKYVIALLACFSVDDLNCTFERL